jgi:fumarate reductase iron-sulfur subunit
MTSIKTPGETKLQPDALDVRIWRGGDEGRFQPYRVPAGANQTVLDVVTWVQRHLEPALAYRFACRVGMCGSCAMTVNGRPRWTCRTHVAKVARAGRIEIGPLAKLPIVKDLVVDMTIFFEKWGKARGAFVPTATRHQPTAKVAPHSPARRAADAGIECINCAGCYAACDGVKWRPDYLGPAALNRAWTLLNDERDGDHDGIIAAVSGDAGCHNCHSHQSCAEHCPKQLNPTAAIAGLKRASLIALLKGDSGP